MKQNLKIAAKTVEIQLSRCIGVWKETSAPQVFFSLTTELTYYPMYFQMLLPFSAEKLRTMTESKLPPWPWPHPLT